MAEESRNIIAASFATPDGGSRAGGAIAGAFPDKVGNTAVLHVKPDGKPKFIESKDWGAGRGALLGGAIGIIGGPLGIVAGGSIGALAAKLRDSGFKNDQLEQLGRSLGPGNSAVVVGDRRRRGRHGEGVGADAGLDECRRRRRRFERRRPVRRGCDARARAERRRCPA